MQQQGNQYRYRTEVNKGSINMSRFEAKLNDYGSQGWRLAHLIEQGGNTVMVWEMAPTPR